MNSQKSEKLVMIIIFGLIYLIMGVWVIYSGVQTWQQSHLSTSWPTVQGEIVKSAVVDNFNGPNYANIQYSYIVDNQLYKSYQVRFSQHIIMNNSRARMMVNRYPVGRSVKVYYKPDDPDTAVLEPGSLSSSLNYFGMSILILSVPFILGLVIYRDYIAPKHNSEGDRRIKRQARADVRCQINITTSF